MRARTFKSHCGRGALSGLAGLVGMAFLLLTPLSWVENAHAATLTVSNVEDVNAGDTAVSVAVSLSNDGTSTLIGGVQMDVSYEPAVVSLSTVKPGAAAQNAGKTLSFNEVSEGVVRIIVAGINQKAIADGVVAALIFDVAANAAPGTYPVAITVAQMVAPTGTQVTGYTVPGTVTIVAVPPEGESGTEGAVEGEGEGQTEGEVAPPSGCACGSLEAPHDPENSAPGILLAACFLIICVGVSGRAGRRFFPRQN
jgi:hypothetical protein